MSQKITLEMEKNEFFAGENINFYLKNIQTTKQEIENNSTDVTAEIYYKVIVVYRYNHQSCFGKNYNANEEFQQHYVQIKEFDEEKQKWTFYAPETIVPTYQYKYPKSGDILDIKLKCTLKVNYKFGEQKGSLLQEITVVEKQQPSLPKKQEKKEDSETILCTKNSRFFTNSKFYTAKWGLDFNFDQIKLTFHGDQKRALNEATVSYQLCFEFKVSDKTFFKPQVNANPRIILQKGDIILQESKGEVIITLPEVQDICPLTTINFTKFRCSHYIILKIEFQNQRFFAENPCEIKIPIEISGYWKQVRENCQVETQGQNTMEMISDKLRNNDEQNKQQETINLQKEYYFQESLEMFECYYPQNEQTYQI